MLILKLNKIKPDKYVFVSEVCYQKKIESSQLKASFFYYHLFEKIKTIHLQSWWSFSDNNLSKNNSKKAFWLTKPNKNLGFLYL